MDERFQRAEDQYLLLRGQLALGRITREQFEASLKELMVEDTQGRYWMLGADTGKWYVHNGTTWVEAQPPTAGSPPASPPAPPLSAYVPPPAYVPPSSIATPSLYAGGVPPVAAPARAGISPLLVGIGAAAAMFLLAAIGFLVASSTGIIKLGLASPTNTPVIVVLPTVAPLSTVTAPTIAPPTPAPPTLPPPPTGVPATLPPPTLAATPAPSSMDLVKQADELYLQSKFDQAVPLYERASKADPKNAVAVARWARLLSYQAYQEWSSELWDQALTKAKSAAQLAPDNVEVQAWLALVHNWAGTRDGVRTAAQQAVKLGPDSALAHAALSEAYWSDGKYDDGEREARKAIELDPNLAEAHVALSDNLWSNKQIQAAAVGLEQAAKLEPNLSLRYSMLASYYRSAQNYEMALASAQKAVALYPKSTQGYQVIGAIYREQKQWDKSVEACSAAIKINGKSAPAHYCLARAYFGKGNLNGAKDEAQKALALDPDEQSYKDLVGQINAAFATPTAVVPPSPVATPTPSFPPGLYVKDVRTEPAQILNGQTPTFRVTFINTLGADAEIANWYIRIFEPDKRNAFGETARQPLRVLPGESTFSAQNNWKAAGNAQCRSFQARVSYIDKATNVQDFPSTRGDPFIFYFNVCM